MLRPQSKFDPFHVADHPQLEPEVQRAILASWASDRAADPGHSMLRKRDSPRSATHDV